ncbi:lysophospholipid acyltransferase family protein [Chryseobacterium sp.]|uniref:lysophospholipid acyltransferase family protein n=1 Tax=Chryseobacterium sp. TaxID=1871047 RepID=UPI0012A9BAB8|nr:lysophospholipid acyltransferase family protein [Chryseobacterium sp.]QFG52682.1 lipid A biosynthesis acyltransferase [Chryseobacterium sp.]
MNFIFNIILLFSRLPMRVLYLFSDVIFFVIFYIMRYRTAVVLQNLKNSFPEKSEAELKTIRKKFYRNFSDYLVETLKAFTVSTTELKVRVQHINRDVFHKAHAEGKNIIMLTGHIFNWEWFTALATMVPQSSCRPVYRRMQNAFWDKKIRSIRNAHGNLSLEAGEVIRDVLKTPNNGDTIYMFVADQTPNHHQVDLGIGFLNQSTPVFRGYDKLATRMNLQFVYCEMKKVKRGFYQVNYHTIEPDGERFVENEVVLKFHKMLENTIKKNPDNYLWSHRKWKYSGLIKSFLKTDSVNKSTA